VRGAQAKRRYRAQWFDSHSGTWIDAGTLTAGPRCYIDLPAYPSDDDWALKLALQYTS
jgi:hypothetical protein